MKKIEAMFSQKSDLIICVESVFMINPTLDQIEDLEMNLTDIIKKLQDYRLSQNENENI